MEKKSLYVVTETIVRISKKEVTTFVAGASQGFGVARAILKDSSDRLKADGFNEKSFDFPNKWEWTYSNSDYIIKGEIIVADNF